VLTLAVWEVFFRALGNGSQGYKKGRPDRYQLESKLRVLCDCTSSPLCLDIGHATWLARSFGSPYEGSKPKPYPSDPVFFVFSVAIKQA
jgi:hypothetical protein